jgi:hypothetical protein
MSLEDDSILHKAKWNLIDKIVLFLNDAKYLYNLNVKHTETLNHSHFLWLNRDHIHILSCLNSYQIVERPKF